LKVYQLAFKSAMEIFKISADFPKDEKYSLTDQIRRSSRSVCSNLAEGWHKRRYLASFICKLSDSIQEASETQTWLDFSFACSYLNKSSYEELYCAYKKIIAQLITMEQKASSFCRNPKK
jgi:four helix bundle protein